MEENSGQLQIIHVMNRNDTFHLTRQTILDSSCVVEDASFSQEIYTLFYHAISLEPHEFNSKYKSFAYIKHKGPEAKLYLNAEIIPFQMIMEYIQTKRIDERKLIFDSDLTTRLIDLADVLGMTHLMQILRSIQENFKKCSYQMHTI